MSFCLPLPGQADNFSYTIQASAYHTPCYQQSMLRGVVLLVSMRPFVSRLESDSQWPSRVFLTRTRNNESDHVVGPTVACESPNSLAKTKQNQPNQKRSIKHTRIYMSPYHFKHFTTPAHFISPLFALAPSFAAHYVGTAVHCHETTIISHVVRVLWPSEAAESSRFTKGQQCPSSQNA